MRCAQRFIFMQIKLSRPRSIYQYPDMATRLTEQTSKFGDVFLVSSLFLKIVRQKKIEKIAILNRKPRKQLYNITLDHVRLIFYTWYVEITLFLKKSWHQEDCNPGRRIT